MRRILVSAVLLTAAFGGGGSAQALCAADLVCALDGCTGFVSVCPTAQSCTGFLNVCPAADRENCAGNIDVCDVPCFSDPCFNVTASAGSR